MRMLGRVTVALVTPFDDEGRVVAENVRRLARYVVNLGAEGVVVGATTGEAPTLSAEERRLLLEATLAEVGDEVPVWASTGTYSTKETVLRSKEAESEGADGLLVVTPYYNRPPQEGLYAHFLTVAQETALPLMIYNIPGRTGVNILPETLARLNEAAPNVVAVKESSGDLGQAVDVLRLSAGRVRLFTGEDALTLPTLAVGGYGVVSVAAHLVADRMRQMVDAYLQGNVQEATRINQELKPLCDALFATTNPIPVKWALQRLGLPVGDVRPPLCALLQPLQQRVELALRDAGLLPRG